MRWLYCKWTEKFFDSKFLQRFLKTTKPQRGTERHQPKTSGSGRRICVINATSGCWATLAAAVAAAVTVAESEVCSSWRRTATTRCANVDRRRWLTDLIGADVIAVSAVGRQTASETNSTTKRLPARLAALYGGCAHKLIPGGNAPLVHQSLCRWLSSPDLSFIRRCRLTPLCFRRILFVAMMLICRREGHRISEWYKHRERCHFQ